MEITKSIKLGNAICEEGYGKELKYVDGLFTPIVVCKEKSIQTEIIYAYDGVDVKIDKQTGG